jgi:hypothetical protein
LKTKILHLTSLLLFLLNSQNAQVSGIIVGPSGEPLPFASVYLQGTSKGTTSNVEGRFSLDLEDGTYQLVFQYIGYKQQIRKIQLEGKPLELRIIMEEEAVELSEVVVRADQEDPAYRVIRAAMEKRKYFLKQVDTYACEVYIKGNIKFLNAPEKFLGQEIGDLDGNLDSNRQGIIYLSESEARLYFKQPDKYKEIMQSTKVSGNDNGFGFNQASEMDFNLYRNYSLYNRQIISPIASNALGYYRYRLEGTFFDQEGNLINKIEVIPKRSEDPVYQGYIYIIEDLWNIQSVDLTLMSGAMKIPGLDSLMIQQQYVPVQQPDVWQIFSQTIDFQAGLFGFKLQGVFTAIYSDYEIGPELPEGFFDNEIFLVEEKANDRSLDYWQQVRPIPLTDEEAVDYVKKDSLQEIRQSKPYLDSVDQKNNRFKALDLLFGYNYQRSYRKEYLSFGSPLTTIQFNTVQGWNAALNVTYRRFFDDYSMRWFSVNPRINYGFSDRQLRASVGLVYNFNRTHFTRLQIEGGRATTQYNSVNPISPTLNTQITLWYRDNFMKIYEREFVSLGLSHEIINGLYFTGSVEYARRKALVNTAGYSLRLRDRKVFSSNNPLAPDNFDPAFEPHEALLLRLALRIRLDQKYSQYPGRKYLEGSKWPDFWIVYRKGVAALGSDVNYDMLAVQLRDYYIPMGVWGRSVFRLEAGKFFNKARMQFMDFEHFNGNQANSGNPARYNNSFFKLPYYDYSTDKAFLEMHIQHYFEGFILDKIPAVRKLGWMMVVGLKYLKTPTQPDYTELSFGIDNIGIGPLRLFRLDGIVYGSPNDPRFGLVLGMKL